MIALNLSKLSKEKLLEKCQELGIKRCKSKNKEELIKLLNEKYESEIKECEYEVQEENTIISNDTTNENTNEETNGVAYNNYYVGDNLEYLNKIQNETIDLIYFDPPYNTGRDFFDFDDKFKSKEDYIHFIKARVTQCFRVLKKTGTLVVHIEPKVSHYFRMICDDIFGDNNFRNEIVWQTGGNAKNKYKLNRFHDTIIVYSKSSSKQNFNPIYFEYNDEYKKKSNVKFCEIYKKEYVTTALYNAQPDVNPRPNLRYAWNGFEKQWYVAKDKMETLHNENRLEYNKDGIPRIKRFLHEMEGVPLRDIWCDINNVQSGEKINYATQKPVKLLERIVKLYSNENDVCLDIFAGSGTLGRACKNMNRKFILFDINEKGRDLFLESIQ